MKGKFFSQKGVQAGRYRVEEDPMSMQNGWG